MSLNVKLNCLVVSTFARDLFGGGSDRLWWWWCDNGIHKFTELCRPERVFGMINRNSKAMAAVP